MIFINGDTQGIKDTQKFETEYFKNVVNKTGNTVIVTGDMGVTWTEEAMQKCIDYYGKFDCTFLFVDGNNDNFDILNKLPVATYCGGKVHAVSKNLIHLMRGEIFDIEGTTFLAFGGADSWDSPKDFVFDQSRYYDGKGRRTAHKSWWKEERPSNAEFLNAIKNIEAHNNKVDVILTHETRTKNLQSNFYWSIHKQVAKMNDCIFRICDFKHWYFGHHHYDVDVSKVERCVFNDVFALPDMKKEKYKSEYQS